MAAPHVTDAPPELDSPAPDGRPPQSWRDAAWLPVAVAVTVKLVLNALVSGRYGWHNDELYYADTGRHLAWGYVDFPSVTPVLAAVTREVLGDSLVALRLVASVAGAATLVVVSLLVRRLGGGRNAQVLAMLGTFPMVLGSNAMFQTVSFDLLMWALVLLAFLRLRPGPEAGDLRRWAALGATVALAWATKYTVGVLVGCLVLGLVSTRAGRARWSGRGVALAAGIVTLTALPNLWWQARHGWPSVDFFAGRHGTVSDENPPLRFVAELFILATPLALPVWVAGVRRLLRPEWRHVGVAAVLVPPVWLVLGGKAYYGLAVFFVLHAAGAVSIAQRWAERGRRASALPWAIGVSTLLSLPLIVPVLPTATMVSLGLAEVRDDYAAELGWHELAADIDRAWAGLSPDERSRTVVLAGDYGSAGAIRRFGRGDGGQAPPVLSPALTNRYWPAPASAHGATAVLVVDVDADELAGRCADLRRLGTVRNRWDVENEQWGVAVSWCRLRPGLDAVELRDALAR
jgi:4-amino-4-deoxy-L-arabinose transferase-like glycosyltransferase